MEAASRLARHVEKALRVDLQRLEQAIDSPDAQLGEVGERRAQVRRADGGEAETRFCQDSSASSRRASSPPMLWPIR